MRKLSHVTLAVPLTDKIVLNRAQNPGALAGLIIGLCVFVTGIAIFAWFTINRHRLRELENKASEPPPISAVRYSTSAGDAPLGHAHSRAIEDDPDLEIQSFIGSEMRPSSIVHGPSLSGILGLAESPEERVDYEAGYFSKEPTVASSNGHSSHGHPTIITRNSSLTHVTGTRNTSPTLSRQNPNHTRFSISPERLPIPSSWQISKSEGPTRRASIDDGATVSYHPHMYRVNSDPVLFHDAPPFMPPYHRRQSSEVPRPEMVQVSAPYILVHPAPPSSLLRPPSATQIPTRETLQQVYPDLPFLNEPIPDSPAASNASILPMRENLLDTPLNHPSSSSQSLTDGRDYSRPLSVGVSVSRSSQTRV